MKQFIVPGYQERLLERDAQALAERAADIFQNEPVENWYVEAMKALARYRLAVGRPISEELQDKFLEYVRIQAGNAKLQREFQNNLRKLRTLSSRPTHEDSELSEVVLDLTQMGLDLTGIFDPTPISDGASAIISVGRQDWSGAAMSAAGMIPILGDLAKLGKLGRYPKQLARAMALALKSEKAAALLRPILKQLEKLIECIPLEMLRDSVRAPLESLKKQLDNFFRKADLSEKNPGTALVPTAPFELGKWGETRLAQTLGGQGVKPSSAFKTSLSKRFVDRLVNGVAHEAKAGINVGLDSKIREQVLKDAELIASRQVRDVVWHFYQGAQQELLDFLTKNGIKYMVH